MADPLALISAGQADCVSALHSRALRGKELGVSGKHESEDDKRREKIQENGERPKDKPLPKEDPGGKHRKENDEKDGK
jgi:hypothetical protein